MHLRFLAAILISLAATAAQAAEIACPKPAKSCKILTFTPEEEQAMMAPKMILDTAATARLLDLKAIADYFSKKFQDAQPVAGEAAPDVPLPQPRPDTAPK